MDFLIGCKTLKKALVNPTVAHRISKTELTENDNPFWI